MLMRIKIEKQVGIPIYLQISSQIRDMILSGELPEGFCLPSERKLSEILKVDRSTVLKAYNELKADAFIESYKRKCTKVVCGKSKTLDLPQKEDCPTPWEVNYNEYSYAINDDTYNKVMNNSYQSDIISFAGGIPAKELYPAREILDIQNELLQEYGEEQLPHCHPEGYYGLRESIVRLMEGRNIFVDPKQIMIFSGSQQGLHFVATSFINPGDIVIVEEPTYVGAIQCFKAVGAKIIGVPMDGDGMKTDLLEEVLKRHKVKFIYTTPTFHNPTGSVMALDRRYQLLKLAYKYQVPILEDDAYGELRYEGSSVPSLKALDKYGYVMYLSTFTRTLFFEIRVGWCVAPVEVIKRFACAKPTIDIHSNTQMQMVVDAFLKRNLYEKHLQSICSEYIKRRDTLLEALEENKIPGMEWSKPKGGIYIWCRLPKQVNQSKLMIQAAAYQVTFMPGAIFYTRKNCAENYIRLNFTFPSPSQIEVGIKRLTEAIKDTL